MATALWWAQPGEPTTIGRWMQTFQYLAVEEASMRWIVTDISKNLPGRFHEDHLAKFLPNYNYTVQCSVGM